MTLEINMQTMNILSTESDQRLLVSQLLGVASTIQRNCRKQYCSNITWNVKVNFIRQYIV